MKAKYIYMIVIAILAVVFIVLLVRKAKAASPANKTNGVAPGEPAPSGSGDASLVDKFLLQLHMSDFLKQDHTLKF